MTTAKPKSMSTIVIAVVSLVGCAVLTVPCVGVVSAIAIPAFVGYVRRSKTAEVAPNIRAIRAGIEAYAMSERLGDGVTSEFLVDGQLDPSSGEIAWAPGLVITNELE